MKCLHDIEKKAPQPFPQILHDAINIGIGLEFLFHFYSKTIWYLYKLYTFQKTQHKFFFDFPNVRKYMNYVTNINSLCSIVNVDNILQEIYSYRTLLTAYHRIICPYGTYNKETPPYYLLYTILVGSNNNRKTDHHNSIILKLNMLKYWRNNLKFILFFFIRICMTLLNDKS